MTILIAFRAHLGIPISKVILYANRSVPMTTGVPLDDWHRFCLAGCACFYITFAADVRVSVAVSTSLEVLTQPTHCWTSVIVQKALNPLKEQNRRFLILKLRLVILMTGRWLYRTYEMATL